MCAGVNSVFDKNRWNLKIHFTEFKNSLYERKKYNNEIKNGKSVDKFERSGYNRSKERLKTENM